MKGAPNMIPCRPKKGGQGQLSSSFQQANLRNICRALVSAAEAALPLLQGPPQNADHPLAQIDSKPATGVGSVSLRFPRLAPGASILHSPARTTKSLCSEAGRSRPPGRRSGRLVVGGISSRRHGTSVGMPIAAARRPGTSAAVAVAAAVCRVYSLQQVRRERPHLHDGT